MPADTASCINHSPRMPLVQDPRFPRASGRLRQIPGPSSGISATSSAIVNASAMPTGGFRWCALRHH